MRYTEAQRKELSRLSDWLDLAQRTKDPYLIEQAKRWIKDKKFDYREAWEAKAD